MQQAGIDVTLICDSMAAQVMKEGRVQLVIVGADRIAANGDTANKIGTYGVALLAKAHGIPFYVAAPSSTFDLNLPNGDGIPIEQRDPREVTHGFGRQTAPDGVAVYNPAFDVTPAGLIAGLITEKGLIQPVTEAAIRERLGREASQVWEGRSEWELPELRECVLPDPTRLQRGIAVCARRLAAGGLLSTQELDTTPCPHR